MSQRVVESILGRLITDATFRERFFAEPALVCRSDALDLTTAELSALLRLEPAGLQVLTKHLDPKIVRAVTVSPGGDDPTRPLPERRPRVSARAWRKRA